jgi:Cytochrome P460
MSKTLVRSMVSLDDAVSRSKPDSHGQDKPRRICIDIRQRKEQHVMWRINIKAAVAIVVLPSLVAGIALAAQDRYTLQVPGGLAWSEFKGYEDWQVISISHNGDKMALIVGNPTMIEAYKAGAGNGKPFPDGAMMAKTHWVAKKREDQPGGPVVAGALHDVDLMVKDSKRFADSGGWGYAEFEYDPAAQAFRPGNTSDDPPQEHDAKCGFACHTIVADKDYVFTAYPQR